MIADELEITTAVDCDVTLVSLKGDLDLSTAPRVISEIRECLARTPRRVDVDCAQIGFLDSAGIRALIVSRNEAQHTGVALGIVNPSAHVQRVLDMTGLGALLVL